MRGLKVVPVGSEEVWGGLVDRGLIIAAVILVRTLYQVQLFLLLLLVEHYQPLPGGGGGE